MKLVSTSQSGFDELEHRGAASESNDALHAITVLCQNQWFEVGVLSLRLALSLLGGVALGRLDTTPQPPIPCYYIFTRNTKARFAE